MNEVYFSIIIPMYNQEKYIVRCLESIVSQSMFDKVEVIVIDDGSTDSSTELVRKYILTCGCGEQIKIFTQSNKGPGGARNTGVKYAVGKYIWFVDSDDTIKNEAISSLYKLVVGSEPEILMFDMDEVDANGRLLVHSYTYNGFIDNRIFSLEEHKDVLGSIHSASNRIFCKKFYKNVQINFPDRLYFEDLMTIPMFLCRARKIMYVQYSYYNYYHNEGSILHGGKTEKYIDVITVMDNLVNFFVDNKLMDNYRSEFEYMIILHAYLMVSARIIKQDYTSKILKEIREYIKKKWPQYHKNVYIKQMKKKYKVSLWCIDHGIYQPIYYVLNREGK